MAFAAPLPPLRRAPRPLRAPRRPPSRTPRRRPVATLATPRTRMDAPPAAAAPATTDPVETLEGEESLMAALARSASQIVVLRVHARWCRSCRALEPKWRRLAREMPDVHFCELEFEANKPLAKRLGVERMPTFLVYDADKGRVDNFSCGPQRAQVLRDRVEAAVESRRQRLAGESA